VSVRREPRTKSSDGVDKKKIREEEEEGGLTEKIEKK